MMNSINVEDDNIALLFEHVIGEMINQSITNGTMDKDQIVVMLEDMIQMVQRGTLASTLEGI